MPNRRATLEGLARILDAGSPEELFSAPEGEAALLYELLVDAARARDAAHYGDVCRVARRRGVTPEYVADRAVVLLAAMRERRRLDLYRILGVPPLASGDVIRQRWLDVAKRHHPDVGGDGTLFRHVKQAYEVLRDPGRRAEYEHFWMRALGPFARVAPGDDRAAAEPPPAAAELPPEAPGPPPPAAASPSGGPGPGGGLLEAASALFAAHAALDRRVDTGLGAFVARVEDALRTVDRESLERLSRDVALLVGDLERLRQELATLADLKRRLRG
jgi:hypothetical protein